MIPFIALAASLSVAQPAKNVVVVPVQYYECGPRCQHRRWELHHQYWFHRHRDWRQEHRWE